MKNESCIFNFEDNRPEKWEIVYDITSKRIKNVCYNYVWIIILYLIILIIIYFKTVQRTAVCSNIHFSRRKISLINIFFFHSLSLSLSPFSTCARTRIRFEARNWLIPARSAFNFDFESVLSEDGTGTRVPGTRNTTSDRDSISRISIGRVSIRYFRVLRARSITDRTDRTCVTRRTNA